MEEPFRLLDLPNDCIANILGRLDTRDLCQIGRVPLGESRDVFKHVLDSRDDADDLLVDVIDVKWNARNLYNISTDRISLKIRVQVLLRGFRQRHDTRDLLICVDEYKNGNGHNIIVYNMYNRRFSTSMYPMYKMLYNQDLPREAVPLYLCPILRMMLPKVNDTNFYHTSQEQKDRIIRAIETVIRNIS